VDASEPFLALSDEDQLSLCIGRVARAHTRLDNHLRNVHRSLAGPGAARYLNTRIWSTVQLADDCEVMLSNASLDAVLVRAGLKAIEAARDSNGIRNRIIHDMWLQDNGPVGADQPPKWNAFWAARGQLGLIARPAPFDIGCIQGAHATLERACLRVSGLFMALHLVETQRDRSNSDIDQDRYLALMHDHFVLAPNGDFDVIEPD